MKAIIFSLHNTLAHCTASPQTTLQEGITEVASWYLKKKHIKLNGETLIETFIKQYQADWETARQTLTEIPARHSLSAALKKIEAPASTTAFLEAAVKIFYSSETLAWQVDPQAVALLKMLTAEGIQCGLYANIADDALLQRLVNKTKLRPWLSPTFSSAEWGWRKPKKEAFEFVANRWGLPAAKIVVVGSDPVEDVQGARNAGMKSVLLQPDGTPLPTPPPTAVVSHLADLPPLLPQLSS